MAEPSTHINYSFEDIQRYLQGKMSAAEMHNIEKAALQDPFLADAIEGYTMADAGIAQQHLNEINAGLFAEKQKSKVVTFNKKTQWLNIAAIVIVLAGIGVVMSYFLQSSNKQQQVAQVKKEKVNSNVLTDSSIQSPGLSTAKPDSTLLIAANKNLKKENASAKRTSGKINVEADSEKQEAETDVVTMAAPVIQNEPASRSVSAAPLSTQKTDSVQEVLAGRVSGVNVAKNTFSGKVVNEDNQPIVGVSIESADKKTVTVTDLNGNFSLQKNDSLLNVTASTVGYDSRNSYLRSGNNQPIILKGTSSALNDAVVVGYGERKKRNTAADSAMPVGGWQNFNNYVLSQLDKDTVAAPINNAKDLVEMEFLIDKTGNPYNIKVIRPLDEERNTKAIEILRSGPKWTNPSKNKKAKVSINF